MYPELVFRRTKHGLVSCCILRLFYVTKGVSTSQSSRHLCHYLSLIYLLYMSAWWVCYCCSLQCLCLIRSLFPSCWYFCQQRSAPGGLTHFSCARACHIYLFRLGPLRPNASPSPPHPPILQPPFVLFFSVGYVSHILTVCNCVDVSFPFFELLYSQSVFHFPFRKPLLAKKFPTPTPHSPEPMLNSSPLICAGVWVSFFEVVCSWST